MKSHHPWAITALLVTVLFRASTAASAENIYAITDLGTLGGTYSYGFGVNNNGPVVGYSSTAGRCATRAFLSENGSLLDLNNLLSPNTGWTLTDALDINDSGQIVGTGTINGQYHAFLMTPIAVAPIPAARWLFGSGPQSFFLRGAEALHDLKKC